MIFNCFKTYYEPVFTYVKKVAETASDNDYMISKFVIAITTASQIVMLFLKEVFKIDYFGVPKALLTLVIVTILIDAYYGVKKSKMKSRQNFALAMTYNEDSPERKAYLKKSELQKFQMGKLQFTFFKCFTLLGYLYFVKNILESPQETGTVAEILGFAAGALSKAPLGIFWYYDFKSIGENTEYIYGKKAPIFTIIEKIFEPKIKEYLKGDKQTE